MYLCKLMDVDGIRVLRVPGGLLGIRADAREYGLTAGPVELRLTRDEARALAAELDNVADAPDYREEG